MRHIEGVHLVGEVADHDPNLVVVAEAGDVDPHRTTRFPLDVVGHAGEVAHLLEGSLSRVAKEKVLHGIVGHDDVERSVAVKIVEGQPERFADRHTGVRVADAHPRFRGNIGKFPGSVVAPQPREGAGEVLRPAIGPPAPHEAEVLGTVDVTRPSDIIADQQIEVTIAVGIKPTTTCPPVGVIARHPRCGRDIGKFAVTEIAEQPVGANGADEHVAAAVTVKIAHRNTGPIERDVETGSRGHIAEHPRAVVVVEPHRRWWLDRSPLIPRPPISLDQQQVLIAIRVVVEEGTPSPHRLREKFLTGRSILMDKVDAG